MAVYSGPGDLSAKQKKSCDDLLTTLIEKGYPMNPPTMAATREALWQKVFADGWTTAAPNTAPAILRKRTSEETALYIGTLNEDVPIKSKGSAIPAHRRARQPVMLKASFQYGGKLAFFWVDANFQKIPEESVDIDGGLSFEDIKGMVASHYDTNEMDRVGGWNWNKVVHWARHRITAVARRVNMGVGVIGSRPQPLPEVHEDIDELQRVRLIEEYMAEQEEEHQG
ncbi:hypothetical protein N0V92_001049 [Colletotrichum tropicale]|nr:hypothetical protein N0V92_001049 [Colletotrichum tropicale]